MRTELTLEFHQCGRKTRPGCDQGDAAQGYHDGFDGSAPVRTDARFSMDSAESIQQDSSIVWLMGCRVKRGVTDHLRSRPALFPAGIDRSLLNMNEFPAVAGPGPFSGLGQDGHPGVGGGALIGKL